MHGMMANGVNSCSGMSVDAVGCSWMFVDADGYSGMSLDAVGCSALCKSFLVGDQCSTFCTFY